MIVQQQIELLESRVSTMILKLKELRSEKAKLSAEISDQQSAFHKLQEERRVIRKRLEKLLGTLNNVEGKISEK